MANNPFLYQSLGRLLSWNQIENGLEAQFTQATLQLICHSEATIRCYIRYADTPEAPAYAVLENPILYTGFSIHQNEDTIVLETGAVVVWLELGSGRITFLDIENNVLCADEPGLGTGRQGHEVIVHKTLQPNEDFIGLGQKTGNMSRRGRAFTNWNTDYFGYGTGDDPLYASLPFYIGIHPKGVYGIFFDNTFKTKFNFGASNDRFSSFSAEGGSIDYYFFGQPSIEKIIQNHALLTGKMPLPPLWSLGLQQCRYSYYPSQEVLSIARTFRERNIGADTIYLDIHYMNGYKVFTWHPDYFAEPHNLSKQLEEMGFKLVVIMDPGIKIEDGYQAYEQGKAQDLFVRYPDGQFYSGSVWPGLCHFPDFTKPETRKWWADQVKELSYTGVSGYWADMNEPATWGQSVPDIVEFDLDGHKTSHKQAHNLYGMQMARSTFEGALQTGKRPFVLTRAAYAGIQRYAAIWTGDNTASDDHMMLGVRMCMSMSLSSVAFVGMDIGGFCGEPSRALFARWMQIGVFLPLCRIHTMIDNKESDPWSFGETVEAICRNYIGLRYQLLPYWYSLFYENSQTGIAPMRTPILYEPHNRTLFDPTFQNQFLVGRGLLIIPVASNQNLIKIYLPNSAYWADFYTGKTYTGNQTIIVDAPLEHLPIFVRAGSIIPMQTKIQHTNQKPDQTLDLHLYYSPEERTEFELYQDQGEGFEYQQNDFNLRKIVLDPFAKQIRLESCKGERLSQWSKINLYLFNFEATSFFDDNGKIETQQTAIVHLPPVAALDPFYVPPATGISTACQLIHIDFGTNEQIIYW